MADLTSDSERVQENNLVESEMIYDRNLRDWELELAYNATMKDIDLERVRAFLAQRAPSGWQVCRFKDTEY